MAYWSKIQTSDDGIIPIGSNLFGTCTTGASTQEKVVNLSDFDVLTEGVTIHVWFRNENTAAHPQLKVGSTAATSIYVNSTTGGNWEKGAVISFTYYLGNWWQNDIHPNSGGGGETYSLSISGDTLTLTGDGGTTSSVTIPDDDTTYSIAGSGNTITLTGSDGSTSSATVTNSDTTYTLTKSGSTITLTGSDGSTTSVTDSNTTYNNATQSTNGLMSAADKIKLDGIEAGATKVQIIRW